ncbi:serine O-acetyltransferase [Corynebacterium casei]|uniref:serine O-acetyltransferase n=1 Tax=Corynebacterium casei TaxID=160386 RepID=UPI003FCFA1A6
MGEQVSVSLENLFQLKVDTEYASDLYAFRLLKESEAVEQTQYANSSSHIFFLKRPGLYRVKAYFKNAEGEVSTLLSKGVRFKGLVQTPMAPDSPRISIVGVSTISAFAKILLEKKWEVGSFVDPTGRLVGETFFGIPVVAREDAESVLVGHENYRTEFKEVIPYDLRVNTDDILWREVNRYSAMQTYEMSQVCVSNGLKEGADYLANSILRRFNTRLPHQASIGKGTTLGVGGMGIAIHPKSKIGTDCLIGQNVTIGIRGGGPAPEIGNNVFIGPGAKCLGGKIGDNAVIGANAVVLKEVPANHVVAGVPARVLHTNTDNHKGYTHKSSRK